MKEEEEEAFPEYDPIRWNVGMKEYMELRNFLKRGMTEYPKTRNTKHGARIKLQFLVKISHPNLNHCRRKQ